MSLFKALYRRRCKTPLFWYGYGENIVLRPEIVQQTIKKVKMKASQSRQKIYHDKRRKALEFHEGDYVFQRVIHMTSVEKALKSKNLTPCFICPYQISHWVGVVVYRMALPPPLSNLHDIFHVSHIRKCISDLSHITQMNDVQVRENWTMEAFPIRIEGREVKQLRGKKIVLVKVVWG